MKEYVRQLSDIDLLMFIGIVGEISNVTVEKAIRSVCDTYFYKRGENFPENIKRDGYVVRSETSCLYDELLEEAEKRNLIHFNVDSDVLDVFK